MALLGGHQAAAHASEREPTGAGRLTFSRRSSPACAQRDPRRSSSPQAAQRHNRTAETLAAATLAVTITAAA
jgi:hypothetical protein